MDGLRMYSGDSDRWMIVTGQTVTGLDDKSMDI